MKNIYKFVVVSILSSLLVTACAGAPKEPVHASETLGDGVVSSPSEVNPEDSQASSDEKQEEAVSVEAVVKIVVPENAFMERARQFVPEQVELPKADDYLQDANKSDWEAQYILSLMYRTNTGGIEHIIKGKKSHRNANKNYEMHRWSLIAGNQSAFPGFAEKPRLISSDDLSDIKAEKIVNWLNTASSAGLLDAEFILGMMHFHGVGVMKDEAKGQELVARAALHGLPSAQFFVGMFYEMGIGTSVNKTEALSWFEKAAEAENPDASFVLALKYFEGIDVAKDEIKAAKYRKQSERNHLWSAMLSEQYLGQFENICTTNYDSVELATLYSDDCGGDYDGWDPDLSDAENEKRIFENHAYERSNAALKYSVDYALGWNWLVEKVNENKYFRANLLYAQTLASSGCKAWVDDAVDERQMKAEKTLGALYSLPNANKAVADFANATYLYHYKLRDIIEGDDEENAKASGQKIFDLLQAAADAGFKPAYHDLGMIYDNSDFYHLTEYISINENEDKALEYYEKSGMESGLSLRISNKADVVFKSDPVKSIPIYEKAAGFGDKDALLKLGQMYHNGKYVTKDDNKSLDYYHKCVQDPTREYWRTAECAAELAVMTSKTNPVQSEEMCKLTYHILVDKQAVGDLGQKWASCGSKIESLPKIDDLQTELENEIALEKGKKLSEFFVYSSILRPCHQDFNLCESTAKPLYKESITKAIRGITALVIGQTGKVDLKLIENTYYYLAIFLGMNEKYVERFNETSPIPEAIHTMESYYDVKRMAFFTWYLRQIPYAAKDVYNKNPGSKSWDALLKEADKAINSNEKMQKAFGYEPLKY